MKVDNFALSTHQTCPANVLGFLGQFWEPEPNTGCWLWTGSTSGRGYGYLGKIPVHRYMYAHYKGAIPDGYDIDHLCRNIICVNPEHLEAVSRQTNLRRGLGTKIQEDVAEQIRELYATGNYSTRQLAGMFPVSKSQIGIIVNGRRR